MSIIMKDQADKSWIKTVDDHDHDHHWQEQDASKNGYKTLDTGAAIALFTLLIIVFFAVIIGR